MVGHALILAQLCNAQDAGSSSGERLYQQQCASCHGPRGEGTDEFPERLEGSYSLDELELFIDESMPEGAAEKCVGEDARLVAAFVYGTFYSAAAQARNRQQAARIELSRLTIRQYRNAVVDLIGSFPADCGSDSRTWTAWPVLQSSSVAL